MRFLPVLAVFLAMPSITMANFTPDLMMKYWYVGEAYLNSGEKLKGKIFYEIDKELLLVFNHGQIKTYSPNQVDKFLIIDKEAGIERLFYSIPLSMGGSTRRNYFFEIMFEGNFVFIRKQRARSDGFGSFIFDESRLPIYSGFFDYYFLIDNELVKIKRFKKDAMRLMADHKEKMEVFIQNNGLQLNNVKDQIRALRYYSSLCEEEAVAKDGQYGFP
jgi:hypothetical protein